ncbi:MAG: AraC family transcriptional regulator [Eubacteriales bacterium]|nr:AraC family transcriptional regulator [Eubacteriales bacterium]
MSISIDLSVNHRIVSANSHYYEKPTERLYLDRVLQYHDLIYLVKGQWLITEGNTDYLLEKDDVLFLSAESHHYTRLPCLPNTRTLCIHVTCEPGDLQDTPNALIIPTHQHVRAAPNIKEYFKEIVSVFWSERPRKSERLSSLCNLLMLELADAPASARGEGMALAESIIAQVNNTPYRNFSVSEIAEYFNVSIKTIETTMQKCVGMSFTKYQIGRKLEMVAQQIKVEPGIRFSEIAATFGFCDEFYMSRSFKAKYGLSPSAYRQQFLDSGKLE